MRKTYTLQLLILSIVLWLFLVKGHIKTVSSDHKWSNQLVILKNTPEADFIIRIGDVDNLGFGWPEGFDPFCGRLVVPHNFPWEAWPEDLPGFDRILLSSKFKAAGDFPCGCDRYSSNYHPDLTIPVTWSLPTLILHSASIRNAFLQLFIDDFQAPVYCSKFRMWINNTRFAEGERLLNAIDQTDIMGRLISIPLPEEFYNDLQTRKTLTVKIDENTGAADGYAVDFIRLLVNRKRENGCRGDLTGRVTDKNSEKPIVGAKVWLADNSSVTTDANGQFILKGIASGYELITASTKGNADGYACADIGPGASNEPLIIRMEKGKDSLSFENRFISVGETIPLDSIFFEDGMDALKPTSTVALDRVAAFLKTNGKTEIELTDCSLMNDESNDNRSLCYRRVKACKDYMLQKGIDAGRIINKGFGSGRDVGPNGPEGNRVNKNGVEMRVVR